MQPLRKAMASTTVTVQVVDTNDPPTFHPRTFIVSEEDGARPGIQLGDFNATDPDRPTDSQIRWATDEQEGKCGWLPREEDCWPSDCWSMLLRLAQSQE